MNSDRFATAGSGVARRKVRGGGVGAKDFFFSRCLRV